MRFLTLMILALVWPPAALAEDRFFESGGLKLRYVDRGEGEPVVLIHGLSRDLDRNWVETGLFELLAEKHRVIALDLRGCGKSPRPESENGYGRHMVDDVARLFEHLEIQAAHVIGFSLGGRVALKFAALYPDRVESLTLIGTGGARISDDHTTWDTMAESLRRGEGIAPLAWQMWPTDQPAPSEEQLDAINERFLAGNDPAVLAAIAQQIKEFATTPEEIKALQFPILAIVGSVDRFRAEVEALKNLMPNLQVALVPGASHGNILERPELKESLQSFLSE